ncbi:MULTISPECIES: hypothetical protein [Pseudomonadati]|uniref:Antitermination protein NusG n=1 Tax=Shewanella aestuarii TaxID=1028752 RepID=A0ABT0L242_9GAMM|nr:hypothetical protein [Shewanella aestuarii]MCL1117565.1 hypothetical protein [Shewanella aestuarii]GGN75330.1 hypothetical protein GCM10009193_15430 [Shewanella aestuarii]
MLTKILVTLLVIIGALFYLRRGRKTPTKTQQAIVEQTKHPLTNKVIIYGVIALSMLSTAVFWGWNLYDDNRIVTVQISSPIEAMSSQYQVRKKDIHARKITTVDGIEIRLSNQERVTISDYNDK